MPLSQKQYGKRAEKSVLNTHTTNRVAQSTSRRQDVPRVMSSWLLHLHKEKAPTLHISAAKWITLVSCSL